MTRRVFVDTGAWLALVDRSDGLHRQAVSTLPDVLRPDSRLVTTNLVIAESYTLIRRRIGHHAAVSFLDSLRTSPHLERVYSDQRLELAAEEILRRYADQPLSYVDAVSFAVMQAENMSEAFAFDHHFRVAGFTTVP